MEKTTRVWFVQCKPFSKSEIKSKECEDFQEYCRSNRIFGMGWNKTEFNDYLGKEFDSKIADYFKKTVSTKCFTRAQNLYGEMRAQDVVLSRLNGIYYLGIISFTPKVSTHERLTWYSEVIEWKRLGDNSEIPHHVRGKLSGRNYQGTVAEIDGLSAISLIYLAGIKPPKKKINEDNFFESIGDEDLEDLMAHYMSIKNKNYIILPSSCKKDTPDVEYIMYDPKTEKSITCQTKVNKKIDVNRYLSEKIFREYETIYLFSGAGYDKYDGNDLKNISIVSRKELYDVFKANRHFLSIIETFFDVE
ncbi:MAG: hypothetical protein BWX72_01638 [Firmicutes bacterium ADurb.Bin080]|nr:MAG: hypothetical protein BWX72_01638 [Firmicutes bacterium ADurb.Bin080]